MGPRASSFSAGQPVPLFSVSLLRSRVEKANKLNLLKRYAVSSEFLRGSCNSFAASSKGPVTLAVKLGNLRRVNGRAGRYAAAMASTSVMPDECGRFGQFGGRY